MKFHVAKNGPRDLHEFTSVPLLMGLVKPHFALEQFDDKQYKMKTFAHARVSGGVNSVIPKAGRQTEKSTD